MTNKEQQLESEINGLSSYGDIHSVETYNKTELLKAELKGRKEAIAEKVLIKIEDIEKIIQTKLDTNKEAYARYELLEILQQLQSYSQETKSDARVEVNSSTNSDSSPDNCQDCSGVDTSTTNEESDIQNNILPDIFNLRNERIKLFHEELVGKTNGGRIFRKVLAQDDEFIKRLKGKARIDGKVELGWNGSNMVEEIDKLAGLNRDSTK